MRILHVYKTYFPESQGGLEETIRQICRSTTARGVENRVLTLYPGRGERIVEREEATVVRYRQHLEVASCGMSASALAAFKRQASWADVVHYHFPWPFADVMHFAAGIRAPTVLTYHSDVVRQKTLMRVYSPLMHRFLRSVSSVVATSPNYFVSSDVLQGISEKVEVIPIGLDESTYPQLDPAVVDELEAEVGRDFFLFVGVLRYYKGLHILLDALAGTDLPVVVAGSGPVETELKAHVRRLGLRNVAFLGHVSDVRKVALLHLSRAVVFPSYLRSEAFGVTLVEGAMFGKPLISTEIGTGTSYVNVHGETGLVVPPGDSKDLRGAMAELAADDQRVAEMGAASRHRYEDFFTGDVMGARYLDLYERVLSGPSQTVRS
ncbi:glycosyltransferase [Ectothiorhodospiraceae bacterium WFHF3C12]|nr:glycosyltransferase [Ectothiorhodospiraceae bacterium WFHF3C12]